MTDAPQTVENFECTSKIDFSKPLDTSNLKDKSAVVTGGANGIGGGFVTALAENGAYVTILDINEDKGNAFAEGLKKRGFHVQFVQTDVTSFSSQTAGFKSAISFSPNQTIDIVITAAGVSGPSILHYVSSTEASTTEDPKAPDFRSINVNLSGTYYTTHLALHYFKQTSSSKAADAPSKQLIFVSSLAGYVVLPYLSDYQASKFGVRGLWKSIRLNTKLLGEGYPPFRTNLIGPTFTITDMTEKIQEGLEKMGIKMATVDDCVQGMLRIACDETVYGRAVAIAAEGKNFDLCDDWEGQDGGRELKSKIEDGSIAGLSNLEKVTANRVFSK